GDIRLVKILLEYKADPNIADPNGSSPLEYAVRYNENIELLKLLLFSGANPNVQNDQGETPLMISKTIKQDGKIIAKILIEYGATK
ncbi:MAG: ankyrin repeat domain-containing protein, partial [Fusobacteriaceae bacterium]